MLRRHFHRTRRLGEKISYSKTLQLPVTKFGPKIPTGDTRDALIKATSEQLYQWQSKQECEKFILHDGPPYANGDLHMGHALNKILKDIINRWQLVGHDKKVHYRPGWDCHGLPIEMKALERHIKSKRDPNTLLASEIRQTCRELALEMIDKQRTQFREFAIMSEFDHPYITMTHDYEINQLKVFRKLLENKLFSRQLKPVWWGCETTTALAEAELEYNDKHKSVAIYVKFPAVDLAQKLALEFSPEIENVKFLIWTSTPWTIPANQAICVHEDLDYTLVKGNGEYLVVASDLANQVAELAGYETTSFVFSGKMLIGHHYVNPGAVNELVYPVVHGKHVTATAGSGLVHTAPAHGGDDYLIGKTHDLPIALAVNEHGRYIQNNIPVGYHSLANEKVTTNGAIWSAIDLMKEAGMIYHINKKFIHSYPYDWRSKTPVIQRATPQWFVNIDRIKLVTSQALESATFIPQLGKNRLQLFVQNRSEWCISRQRTWGVPLPIVYHKLTDTPVDELVVVDHIISKMDEFGTDAWFEEESDILRWLPEGMNGVEYSKGRDTMDVWFDLGTSWTTLLESPVETQFSLDKPIADIYLEGSDQHRGWFQSSLLNKIVSSGVNGDNFKPVAPFAKVITHGFTLDGKGQKMSKSKGNVISPKHAMEGGGKPMLPALGTDGLRLWVASLNYTLDVGVGVEILARVFENVKKFRVTFKYLLGNLNNFGGAVEYDQLSPLDKYTLSKLAKLQRASVSNFDAHHYQKIINDINTNMNSELSAVYFDILKDCLYTGAKDLVRRRGIQTVLGEIIKVYLGILAPIQPVLVQEVWNEYRQLFNHDEESPFHMPWSFYSVPAHFENSQIEQEFAEIWQLRDSVYKLMEQVRSEGKFKNKLEVKLNLKTESEVVLRHLEYLDDYFLVSQVTVNEPSNDVILASSDVADVMLAPDHKCPRCWKFSAKEEDQLCKKCDEVVN